ncbi:MAG: RagB/SusD family nutrient uptake outer membrane protein, partial [Bacteroidales bacterium]|nr:RagB/SusD family nutrient uptake outer membrane protein [Bacteroidales bacterium]
SKMGLAFGPYYVYSRYAHGNYLAITETGEAIPNLWNGSNQTYWMGMKEYEATNLDKTMFWKLPYLFEYTDPVARIGYYRTVYPAFTADQVLLERAEANTLLGKYDEALDDVNLWIRNIASADETHLPRTLDLDRVNSWFNSTPYHVWDTSSVKKHLNPKFVHVEEGSTKENMLHCVLALKRVETLGQGLRWFDVKRYGIQLDRRIINAEGRPYRNTGTLEPFDKRTAVQIPKKVRDAGITPNPRDNQ